MYQNKCRPRILLDAFLLDGETRFLFCLVKIQFLEKDLESPLIFKEKKNKKEKP